MERCAHCGATEQLTTRYEWVGGRGRVPFVECRDQVACWVRFDAQQLARIAGKVA